MDILNTKQRQRYQPEIDIILNLLGHPDALVSDSTKLGDFENYETVQGLIGNSDRGDFLWELGMRIRGAPSDE